MAECSIELSFRTNVILWADGLNELSVSAGNQALPQSWWQKLAHIGGKSWHTLDQNIKLWLTCGSEGF